MAVSFVGLSRTGIPGGYAAGDLLIVSVLNPGALPAGWAWFVAPVPNQQAIAYKFSGTSESNPNFALPSGDTATLGVYVAVRGAKSPSPFRTSSIATATPNASINSKVGELVMWFWTGVRYTTGTPSISSAVATAAGLTNWVKRDGFQNQGGDQGNWLAVNSIYTGTIAADGNTGTVSWTRTSSGSGSFGETGILMSIEAAAVPPSGRAFNRGFNEGFNKGFN